ncbi:pyridoxine 5'-phosphate synthase, partial [Fulvivirga sp. RKSG066]|uniref:pyridoxine 5'-phosphate synthase n=1 Tax=Fulvivirga aurantia TaxID=2529383 RepID=UPI0012BC074A
FATLRNARGGNNPDVVKTALDCERFGAEGITVHPRPDERHIRYDDVLALAEVVKTEFNIEGYPDARYMELVKRVKPAQATLVPDPPDVLTSNAGWDTIKHAEFLNEVLSELKAEGIRTSIFVEPDEKIIEGAANVGTDRIELYTESYAVNYRKDKHLAVDAYKKAASVAKKLKLGINAGHDLDLENLAFLKKEIPYMDEVSIGHALVCDAIYLGLENTIQLYLKQLKV